MKTWEERVQAYEAEGMTRSDAQAVVDAELAKEVETCEHGFIRASCPACGEKAFLDSMREIVFGRGRGRERRAIEGKGRR